MRESCRIFDNRIWRGYSAFTVPELESLARDPLSAAAEKAAASWSLARWYAYKDEYERVLEHIENFRSLGREYVPSSQAAILEIDASTKLGRHRVAHTALSRFGKRLGSSPDFCIAGSNLVGVSGDSGLTTANSDAARLAWLNRPFIGAGLPGIAARDARLPLSTGNVGSPGLPPLAAGQDVPKVSILVPAFNASSTLPWVLQSLLEQTWWNIEVIVVDDASTDETPSVISSYGQADGRVVRLGHAMNRGTYAALNTALEAATGDFVTTSGADDWSHADKLRAQMEPIVSGKAMCTASFGVRVDEKLNALLRPLPVSYLFWNVSSLIYPKVRIDEIGGWDEVRMGADSELHSRFEAYYTTKAVDVLPGVPMSLALARPSGLMRAESTGWLSTKFGARREYREAYQYWHGARLAGEARSRLARGRKPFPVPTVLLNASGIRDRVGSLLVSDFSQSGALASRNALVLEKALAAGGEVAFYHWPAVDHGSHAIEKSLRGLFHERGIAGVVPGETIGCRRAIVTDWRIMRQVPTPAPAVSAQDTIVVIDDEYCTRGATYLQSDLQRIAGLAKSCFGAEARFAAASGSVRDLIAVTKFRARLIRLEECFV